MFTRPRDLGEAELVSILTREWGLDVVALEYVAVGFGSHHWRVVSAAGDRFVTVDDLIGKRRDRLLAALRTARALHDAGFEFAIAPERTTSGEVACNVGDHYVVAVYPFVGGQTFDYGSYSDSGHRDEVLQLLAALHRSPTECHRWAATETFAIARRTELAACAAQLDETWTAGPFADPARRLLKQHASAVASALDTYDALAAEVAVRTDRFVLTHGEPHPANTIRSESGVVLVDWDTALIAPPERDLWEMVGEEPSVMAQYEGLTGTSVSEDAVDLYRIAWDLSEIAIYVSDFRRPHERTEDTSEAWQNLQHFLDPTRW